MAGRRDLPQRPGTDDERREYLSQLEASGLSVRAFALRTGVSPFTVYGWRRRLGRTEGTGVLGDFIEVEVTEDDEVGRDSVVGELVIGDITMRVAAGFDSAELARLLDVVRSRC